MDNLPRKILQKILENQINFKIFQKIRTHLNDLVFKYKGSKNDI